MTEKSSSSFDFITSNAIVQRATDLFSSLQEKRKALGLPNPGALERISKEVDSDVLLNNNSFTGLRADITKTLSSTVPLFQVSHQLSTGSAQQPPYTFAVLYGSPRVFMQANLDNERAVMARFNWRWNSFLVTKAMAQMEAGPTGQSMFSLENNFTGTDFTASIKAVNPSILEGGLTGMVTAEYLQSLTSRLSLGVAALWQRRGLNEGPDTMLTYAARYKAEDWIASAQLVPSGALQASYWRRIAEKVEAGVSLNLQYVPSQGGLMGGGPIKPEGTATFGAKYDFRMSQVKAQVDSNGRIACFIEKRVVPQVGVQFVGQIDHVKNESKVGLSISIDAMSDEVVAEQERVAASGEEMINPPF